MSRLLAMATVMLLIAGMAAVMPAQPAMAQDNTDVSVLKTDCPEGLEPAAGDLAFLAGECLTPATGTPFSLVPNVSEGVAGVVNESGIVFWGGMPHGAGLIVETGAEMSVSRVFCAVYETGGALPGLDGYVEYGATNNVVSYTIEENQSIDCRWFNSAQEEEPAGTSFVNLSTVACPAEIDVAGESDLTVLLSACSGALNGVGFVLEVVDGSELTAVIDGYGSFDGVPGGPITLTATAPEGYQPAAVFCATDALGSDAGADFQPVALIDGVMISYELMPESYLECYWFHTPLDAEGAEVRVNKYSCPETTPWQSADLAQLYDACDTPQPDVTFQIGGPATTIEQVTNAAGEATWLLDPGEYQLSETMPAGFIASRAFCGVNLADGGGMDEMQLSQGSFPIALGSGDLLNCVVFNLAETVDPGPASLTINKYTCPAEFDVLAPNADPRAECSLGTDDITFTLQNQATEMSASTGTGGAPATVQFSELEAGPYLLTETTPEPVAMAFVNACTSDVRTFNYPFSPFAVIEPGGRVFVELLPGEDMTCAWFNVLEPEPGTVTITKYWCDGEAGNLSNCQLFGGGIAFSLVPVDGNDNIDLTTGEDGTATVEALGTFELIEQGFSWCGAESEFVDANGNVVVESGVDASVEIYNCGPMPLQ